MNVRYISAEQLRDVASMSKGWTLKERNGHRVLAAEFGGNEMRFRVRGTRRIVLHLATEPYVFMHVYVNGAHHSAIGPESELSVEIPLDGAPAEVQIIRTAVSSGPFYVDAFVRGAEIGAGGEIVPPREPVPQTTFCTFGDSISGNCCIGGPGPFDPHDLGYGYEVSRRFRWQYFNTARDGSGVCCTPFDNPLASDRVQKEVIENKPGYLLVFYGTNDIRGGVPVEQFEPAFRELVALLVAGLPSARIALSGSLWNDMNTDNEIARFNDAIARVAAQYKLPCCQPIDAVPRELITDGVHPNAEGQDALARVFGDFFAAQWPELHK